jgi:arsenate reductase
MDWSGYGKLRASVESRLEEFDQIPGPRKAELVRLAEDIRSRLTEEGPVRIIFICTHNSRRSHMSHLWAQLAAGYYGVKDIRCFSGGTEVTAFHPLALKTMIEAGFRFEKQIPGANPVYRVTFPGMAGDNHIFSKKYTDPPNPTRDFIAVMNCSDADEACPIVHGAASRHAVRYDDPKSFDGRAKEMKGYAERCRQIAREMLFLFSLIQDIDIADQTHTWPTGISRP